MHHFLRKVEILNGLTDIQLQTIARYAVNKYYERGSVLLYEGDIANGLFIIKSGYVKVYHISENGREKTLALLSTGDIIGEMTSFGQKQRSASVSAMEHTEVITISQYRFEEILQSMPIIGFYITEVVTARLRQTSKELAKLAGCSSREKILFQLITLAEKHGIEKGNQIIIQPRLTHSDIASMAGVVRETVTKILNDLKDEQLLTFEERRIVIRDLEMLNQAAEGSL